MQIRGEGRIERPPKEVFRVVRDQLCALLPYLPDVAAVDLVEDEAQSATQRRMVTRWHAQPPLPAAALKFLPESVFSWHDHALWNEESLSVEYRIDGHGFRVRGEHFFRPDGRGTRFQLGGELEVDSTAFGVPKLLFDRISPLIEGSIRRAIEPNFTSLVGAVEAYFAAADAAAEPPSA